MKFEFSAGGVVFKKRSAPISTKAEVQKENDWIFDQIGDDLLILVAQNSQHHDWVFPKGLIGDHNKGESKEEAALREVEEETGVQGKVLRPLTPETYWYQFEGQKIKKTVYYFIMEFVDGDITKHDFEMENVEWLPLAEVEKRLTFPSDKKVWQEAKRLISNSS